MTPLRAFGSDRVRADGERMIIASRASKEWVPRAEKTLTTAQFPGTAVVWEERYFEVAAARDLPQGGVEYVLEPWREHHVMRVVQHYDEPSEAARLAEHRARLARESKRKSANILAPLTGHLPAVVQNRLAEDLGLLPQRLTLASVLGMYAVVVAAVLWIVTGTVANTPRPLLAVIATYYLGIETSMRFLIVWTQSRPIGSPLGLLFYIIWWLATGRRATSPFAVEKGFDVMMTDAPEDLAARDLFTVREPFLTLLPPADQRRIAARFAYDHRRHSTGIAIGILVGAAAGLASSLHRDAPVAVLVAAALAAEQVYRLAVMRRRPVGSVFGFLVRPFVRKLL